MKILITGDGGFIGKNLASSFLMQSIYCIELSDFYYDNKSSNITEKNSSDYWTRELKESLETIHPDIIFHVGACSDTLEKDVNYMMEVNYECTKILVDWAKVNNSKFIYSSSAANYGTGLYPSNLYGWSKYVAEGYVVSNGGIALRYFNVYGPGEEHKGKMSSVAYQSYKKIKEGEAVYLFPGNPKRDFVYVKDIVDANKYAVENYESLKGDWYDIGTYEARSFEDVLEGIGILEWGYKEDIDIPNGYQFYTQAMKKMGSWIPKFSLKEGLKDYTKYLNEDE